ncbi:unnamed protein product [Closterium sp. Naga37s-1]|nr:unnamed protein product [Closterium sp. Naga37s-1]
MGIMDESFLDMGIMDESFSDMGIMDESFFYMGIMDESLRILEFVSIRLQAEIAEQKLEVLKRRGQLHVQVQGGPGGDSGAEAGGAQEARGAAGRSASAEIAEQKLEVLNWRGQLLAVQPESHLVLAWFPHSRPRTPLPPILTKARIEEQKLEFLPSPPSSLSLFKSEPGLSVQIRAEKPLTDAQTTASRVPATTADSGEGGMEMCGTIGSAGRVHEGGELVRVFELGSPLASSAGSHAAAVTPAGVASEGGYNVTTAEEEEQLAAPGSKRWVLKRLGHIDADGVVQLKGHSPLLPPSLPKPLFLCSNLPSHLSSLALALQIRAEKLFTSAQAFAPHRIRWGALTLQIRAPKLFRGAETPWPHRCIRGGAAEGWAACVVMTGKELVVVGFMAGSELVVVGFMAGSELVVLGFMADSELVVVGFMAGSELVVVGFMAGSKLAVVGFMAGSELVVVGFMAGSELVVVGFMAGSKLVVVRFMAGSELVVVGFMAGNELVMVGFMIEGALSHLPSAPLFPHSPPFSPPFPPPLLQLSLFKSELRNRSRVLKRLGHIDSDGLVQLKGRVACVVTTGDEPLVTELMLEGAFNSIDPHQLVAVASCFLPSEKSNEEQVRKGGNF